MILGIPLAGPQPDPIPEWAELEDALSAKKIDIRAKVKKSDWRTELAADDGGWLVWFDVDSYGEIMIGLGLVAHAENEKDVRKRGGVTVRPFRHQRTEVPLSSIIGTLEIRNADRALWATVDGASPEIAGNRLRSGKWNIIRPAGDGAPVTLFSPSRWRIDAAKRQAGLEAA